MAKVQFKRGRRSEMPTTATTDTLLFSLDTNEVFMGRGTSVAKMGDVYYGYADLTDLQTKEQNPISGKLYLTEDSKLYSFQNGTFQLVAGSSEITSFEADKVTYNNTTSALTSSNVQGAIDEVNTKTETNKTDITSVKGRVDTLETDNTQNKADIADLKTKEGLVKLDTNDTSTFLGEKLDGATVVAENGKLVVKTIEGLTIATSQLNLLDGATSNVQTQLNTLQSAISASASGMIFGGKIATKADLANAPKVNGTLVVVTTDEDNDNASTMYVYSDDIADYEFLGKFEFNESFIGLTDTPNTFEDGKFLKSTTDGLVFSDLDYSTLINKPSSTVVAIDEAVTNSHTHTFDEATLNKFSTDAEGELLFDGQKVKNELVWEEFTI